MLNDPLEMHNLADHPEHQGTISELRTNLAAWMKSQGDTGVATEMKANSHKKAGQAKNKSRDKGSTKKQDGNRRKKQSSQLSPDKANESR